MEEKKEVVLHGMWASPFARWVKIALEIKGIAYEYVEENLKNKSELLAKYNPIYKKVPVLVHNGNPIVESLIILQYIDDTWKYPPYLLPSDAYSRSLVRFWGDFLLNQLDITLRKVVASEGVEEEKNIKEVKKHLNTLEENMNVIFPYNSPSCVEDMRMMDIMLCTLPSVVTSIEDAFDLNIMEPQKYPLTSSRMSSLSSLKLVKDTAPPHDKFVKFFRAYRRLYI